MIINVRTAWTRAVPRLGLEQILARLSAQHRDELRRMNSALALTNWPDQPARERDE